MAVAALPHPFTDELLRTLVLTAATRCVNVVNMNELAEADILLIGDIDEIATGIVIRVEQLEVLLLVHGTHTMLFPLVTDGHGTESNGERWTPARGKS